VLIRPPPSYDFLLFNPWNLLFFHTSESWSFQYEFQLYDQDALAIASSGRI